MKTERELRFEIDFSNPEEAFDFPARFAEFLVRADRVDLKDEFLKWYEYYLDHTSTEDLSLWDIARGAAQFAEVYDTSDVPLEENQLLNPHSMKELPTGPIGQESRQTAEQVLEDLDKDLPPRIVNPEYPECIAVVEEGDDIAIMVYKAIKALRSWGYRKASERLAREIRALVRTRPTYADIYWTTAAFVQIKTSERLEKEEELIRQRAS